MPLKLRAPRKGKTPHWTVRGTYLGVYVERSTGTPSKRLAQQFLKKWEGEIERGEFTTPDEPTFLSAAISYMKAGGTRNFLEPLLRHFGERPLRLIDQAAVDAAAAELYPTQTSATRNRQVYTPVSAILKHAGVDPHFGPDVPAGAWVHDPRIKAVVIAAPAFGFAFGHAGLSSVRAPIQLWRAADDRHQPHPYYDEAVRADLPRPPEYHVVVNAGHYDFLPPCDARLSRKMPEICTSLPGFDRAAFHEQFNADVVQFFQAMLQ